MLQIKTIETELLPLINALARIAGHYVSCKMSEIAPKYHCSTSIIHIKQNKSRSDWKETLRDKGKNQL